MVDLSELKFDDKGLIPAIVIDAITGETLMLAYMNVQSLSISIDEGRTCFWSRSRGELWRKGETSGNVQRIVNIKTDCDKDALTVTVIKDGPACHTGAESCFFSDVYDSGGLASLGAEEPFSLSSLYDLIGDRKINRKPGSYTTYLFDKGIDKILKKIGEESAEVIIAGKSGDKAESIYELADLTYHALVLMAELGITPMDVVNELTARNMLGDKSKQDV